MQVMLSTSSPVPDKSLQVDGFDGRGRSCPFAGGACKNSSFENFIFLPKVFLKVKKKQIELDIRYICCKKEEDVAMHSELLLQLEI